MFKVTKNPETGQTTALHLSDVIFSYSYLVTPRPETDFNPGTYGTELILTDQESVSAVKQYLNEVMQEATNTVWEGKTPKQVNLPLKKGNEESELEAGRFVLKTSSKTQPRLFVRNENDTKAREVGENDIDEIYAGMIGEAIVKFRAYSYNGIKGVKAYINAVCKTGEGTPLAKKVSYEEVFSGATEFDTEPTPIPAAAPKKAAPKAQTEQNDDIDLDSMLSQQPTTSKAETKTLSIDDLLND